jgi:hypothetical protein
MPTRKRSAPGEKKPAPRQRAKGRSLVWVDQKPLRRKAASECARAMERLEKARAQWRRFEREDQPAYRRWVAATFGPLMSRVREVAALVREKEILVQEVETEVFLRGSGSYRMAYTRVQKRRANPYAEPQPRPDTPPPSQNRGGADFRDVEDEELDDFEQEILFEEFVRTFLHMNPDRMSDRQYEKMFADFKANMLDQEQPGPREPAYEPEAVAEPPKSEATRIKELYRLLVRRLHPDTKADRDVEVSALWHEVQEAYTAGNLDRLEMLLAFTDIQSKTAGEHTSLFQMQSVLAELRGSYNALQRTLRAAKKDSAWNFVRLEDRSKLETCVRRELESTLAWHEMQLGQLEALIAKWSAPPKPRNGRPRPRATQAQYW